MRTKMKRYTAAGLAVVLAISLVVQVLAATQEPSPNMALLDEIIYGERKWVWDTLICDERDTNPLAYLMGDAEENSLAKDAINKFYGIDVEDETYAAIYRYGVLLLNHVYSPEEVVQDLVDETGNLLSWVASYFSGTESLQKFLDDMVASSDELNYDKILKSVFSEKYTSSTGFSLGDTEASYIFLQGLKDSLDMLSSAADAIRSDSSVEEDHVLPENNYINEYMLPLQSATEEFLNGFSKLLGTKDNFDCKRISAIASTLATISYYQQSKPLYEYRDHLKPKNEQIMEGMVDKETGDLLKAAGKVIDFASTSIDTYIYIQSIKHQRDALTGPISRLTGFASNPDMQKSFDNYNHLINTELDNKVVAYESIVSFLREEDVIGDAATDLVKSLFKKTNLYKNSFLSSASLASDLSTIEIALWLGDKVTGVENTCKKTALLLRWEEIMDAAVQSYKQSELTYMNARTEENAKNAIEDLMLIQRLRLYGEKIAYDLTAGQFESWFGQFFCGQTTSDQWKTIYQRNVDILLAASPVPPMSGLNIKSGEQAFLRTDDTVGLYISTDKGYIVNAAMLLAGGITCNGGTLYVGDQITHLGTLQTSQNSTLLCASNTFFEDFYVKDGTTNVTVGSGGSMTIGNMTLHGAMTGSSVHVNGSIDASGGGRATALKLIGPNTHTVSGSLTASTFYIEAGPVDLQGNVTVTSELYGPDAEITNPQNMLLSGGTVVGGSYPELLRVQNAKLTDTEFEDQLKDLGGTTYSGTVTVEGAYSGQGTSSIAEGAVLDCQSDAFFTNMTLNGTGQMDLHGDVSFSETTAEAPLNFCGRFPQQVSGTATVRDITFANRNKNGITLDGKITVRGILDVASENLHNTENLYLTEQASVAADEFSGNLSFENWSGDKPLTVKGNANIVKDTAMQNVTLHVTGDCTSGENVTYTDCDIQIDGKMSSMGTANLQNSSFDVEYIQCSSMTLENSHISADQLRATGTHLVGSGSTLSVSGGAAFTGILTTDGKITIQGDCTLNDATVSGQRPFVISGDLAASGTAKIHHLILDGALDQNVSGEFTADILELKNTAPGGVTVTDDITVLKEYRNENTVVTGEPHIVSSGVEQLPGTRLEWSNVTLDKDTHVLGDLYLVGDLTLNGAKLTVDGDVFWTVGNLSLTDSSLDVGGKMQLNGGNFTATSSEILVDGSLQWGKGNLTLIASELTSNRLMRKDASTGTLTIDADSTFYSKGAAQLQYLTIKLDGQLLLGSDAVTTSAPITGGGTLLFRSDLQADSPITLTGGLEVVGKLPQTISGSGAIHVGSVTFDNPYKTGVTLTNSVYYSGTLEMGETVITGAEKLVKEGA